MAEDRSATGKPLVGMLLELAKQAAAEARYDAVIELFHRAQQDEHAGEGRAREWQLLLLEAGAFEEAARLGPLPAQRPEALAVTSTVPSLVDPGADLEGKRQEPEEDEFLRFEPAPRKRAEPVFEVPERLVAAYLQWFAGRGDVYARQWYDARNDRTGYVPVREPLTAKVIEQHLLGRMTIGQYLLFPDDSVSFAVLDLDPTQAAWERMRLEDTDRSGGLGLAALRDYAMRIAATAREANVAVFLEDTGGAGLHVWLFFAPRVSAKRARALCRELLFRSGPQPPEVQVEVFPKQDHLSGKGLGNLVKLPLGLHQATVRRSSFLDEQLQPLPDEEGVLRLAAVPVDSIERFLERRVVPLRPSARDSGAAEVGSQNVGKENRPAVADLGSPRVLAEALATIPSGKEVQQAVDRIVEGCAVVRELLRRAMESEVLPAPAARALVYSIGLVGRENETIDRALALAGVSRKELERVRKGLQSPIGCKRLIEPFPQFAGECSCPEAPEGGYATPVLFAFSKPPRFPREESVFVEDDEETAAELLLRHDEGLQTGVQSTRIEDKLDRIERVLDRLVDLMERVVSRVEKRDNVREEKE